jgi:TRAP-type mannitol/chloroaromatic compound transport system permease small subunit
MQKLGQKIKLILDRLSLWLAVVGAFGIALLMFTMVLDALGRKLVSTVPGAFETSKALMVLTAFLPQAYTQMRRGHIWIDIFVQGYPKKTQGFLTGMGALLGSAAFGLLAWLTGQVAWESTLVGEFESGIINFPTWPVRWLIPVGLWLLVAQLLRTVTEEFGQLARKG